MHLHLSLHSCVTVLSGIPTEKHAYVKMHVQAGLYVYVQETTCVCVCVHALVAKSNKATMKWSCRPTFTFLHAHLCIIAFDW